jgi:hypothetical protein
MPYEYKVGGHVILETPGILWELSTPCTGPYPVTQVKNNGTVQIQKGIVTEQAIISDKSLLFNKSSGYA